MLSYRHGLHAGSVHDVFKHVVLCALLDAVTRKESPFLHLDTHAGAALHDLERGDSRNEHALGIARLHALRGQPMPAVVARYLDIVAHNNRGASLRYYPGSPLIARAFLRSSDRAVFVELDVTEFQVLKQRMSRRRNEQCVQGDGYATLRAELPPIQRRGLVLIDPGYERRDEPVLVVQAAEDALRRFGHGVVAIWYPIGGKADARLLVERLQALAPGNTLTVSFMRAQPPGDGRARGSGLCIFNPPFRVDEVLAETLPWLASALAPPEYVFALDGAH